MADNSFSLDPGFEEVSLDEGFEEVPLKQVIPTTSREAAELAAASPESIQTLKALGTGALQGATFGFSDELGAGVDVAGDVLTGKGTEDLYSKWEEYQKQREAANKALAEESPIAYGLGEITGGIGGAVLTPALGVGKGLVGLTKALPIAGRLIKAGELTSAELSALGKAAPGLASRATGKAITGAVESIPVGAAYGAGTAEQGERLSGAEQGALMGALAGGAVSGAIKTGKEIPGIIKKYVEEQDVLSQLGPLYKLARKGFDFGTKKTEAKLSGIGQRKATRFAKDIFRIDDALGEEVGNTISAAENNNIKINIKEDITNTLKSIENTFKDAPLLKDQLDPSTKKLLNLINTAKGTIEILPSEAQSLKQNLNTYYQKIINNQDLASNKVKEEAVDLIKKLDNTLKEQVPGFKEAADNFSTFRQQVPETIIGKGISPEFNNIFLGRLKDPELKTFKAVQTMIEKGQLTGVEAAKERATLEQLRKNLLNLQKEKPEILEKAGQSAEQLYNKLQKQSDLMAAIRQLRGREPEVTPDVFTGSKELISKVLTGSKAFTPGVVGVAGKVARVASPMTKMGAKLFKGTDEALFKLANSMKNSKVPGFGSAGKSLEQALLNKDKTAKNAILFNLMQNPDYRNLLKEEGFDEEE